MVHILSFLGPLLIIVGLAGLDPRSRPAAATGASSLPHALASADPPGHD